MQSVMISVSRRKQTRVHITPRHRSRSQVHVIKQRVYTRMHAPNRFIRVCNDFYELCDPDFVEQIHEGFVNHEGNGNVEADSGEARNRALVEGFETLVL